ncbi:ABC transporter ATP-binding protein [Rubrimonas sp.]|uniref:ABC transporter ATP-binding protein n=1 Tax=Rubrimonas sp. TaxID=2036015 RepID=UPI002FDD73B2
MGAGEIVLDVRGLTTEFALRTGSLRAVDDVSFTLHRGRTLCVVGESGSGKSVTARSILQIVPAPGRVTAGTMALSPVGGPPVDLAVLDPRGEAIRRVRGATIAMIFQEPMSSLSPVHRIGSQIDEVLELHTSLDKPARRARIIELLGQVEIPEPEKAIDRFPFEYSGGMRQRAMIAMALAGEPEILIADEPTTALDVTTQAEILDLLKGLQRDRGMAVMFITHDMGVVAEIADDVCVMYRGKAVENGPVEQIFHAPRHPYTRMLIETARRLERPSPTKPVRPAGGAPILTVQGVSKQFNVRKGFFSRRKETVDAVRGASLTLYQGETLGIVGESGSGKTTLGRMAMCMIAPTAGRIDYVGADGATMELTALDRAELRAAWREMRMIFQDPYASLNPRMTVEQIIGEPLHNLGWPRAEIRARIEELLALVGLDPAVLERYPHAFSGGQRQRIGIARALAPRPRLIVADEATSALDVSLRAQVLDLLLDIQQRMSLSFLFVSHDISVIRYFCDRVAVMRQGEIVEIGSTAEVCVEPQHPYTRALLSAVPRPDPRARRLDARTRYTP